MKVDDFIKQYGIASRVKGGGERFIEERIVKQYVPFLQKVAICNKIVDVCWHIVQSTDNNEFTKKKRFKINSTNAYLLFSLQLIKCYTDIEVMNTGSDFGGQYDALNSSGLFIPLMMAIPESERKEFQMVKDMVESDADKNEYYIGSWLTDRLDSMATLFGIALSNYVKTEQIKDEDIKKLIQSFIE